MADGAGASVVANSANPSRLEAGTNPNPPALIFRNGATGTLPGGLTFFVNNQSLPTLNATVTLNPAQR